MVPSNQSCFTDANQCVFTDVTVPEDSELTWEQHVLGKDENSNSVYTLEPPGIKRNDENTVGSPSATIMRPEGRPSSVLRSIGNFATPICMGVVTDSGQTIGAAAA